MTPDTPSVTLLLQTPDGHIRAVPSRRTHIQHRLHQARAAHHQNLALAAVITTPAGDLADHHPDHLIRDDWYQPTLLNDLDPATADPFTTKELQTTDRRLAAAAAAARLVGTPADTARTQAVELARKLTQTGETA